MKKLTIACEHCKGTGKRKLTGVYADTLRLLGKYDEVTGAKLCVVAGCKPPAMNNRLAALERLGLATSRRYGRERLFAAI